MSAEISKIVNLNIISLKIECDFETQTCKDKFELSLCFSNYI